VASIIRKLPYDDRHTKLTLPGGDNVLVLPYQIVIWISITPTNVKAVSKSTPRLPAVIDTGFNHSLLIREEHLSNWAGLAIEQLSPLATQITAYDRRVRLRAANVWLYSNRSGKRDELLNKPPTQLPLYQQVAVCPSDVESPRLPLLGLRALTLAGLDLRVNGEQRSVTISKAKRLWFS
jgi:hypothetical protein